LVSARINESGLSVPIGYLDASSLARAFPGFAVECVVGLGVMLPPPYLHQVFSRWPRFVQLLDQLDWRLAMRWPFSHFGDHVAVVMHSRRSI
jgi:hypothetical protein